MNQENNINFNPIPHQHNLDAQLPRVSISSWHYRDRCWKAYKLPNGSLFMSDRQMALLVGQPKNIVRSFIESQGYPTLTVQIDNGVEVQVYPLSVAAIYLSTLLKNGDLDKHPTLFSRREWHSLIKALCKFKPASGNTPNPCFFTGDYWVKAANPLSVEIETNMSIQILVLHSGEYHIEYQEGLRCVQHDPAWLVNYSSKKARILSDLNLSKDITECRVITKHGFKSVYALSIQDWLSIWGHFANKGNRLATAILKACASVGIDLQIERAISQNK
ncbi:hypothetical protein NIES267_55430 [Calothrix parasitica NIES-267]|uniref:Uncharacterized protein n=1 Tax=Calothrix parasitica NIES-267 TaxID=1973488 RepID=A0A1Z4LXQ6_9CYAN|nr:hypothetical protein NIES267_55430 [Calothrix parasitica NIES-267]